MEPKYDHKLVEGRIYEMWEKGGYFKPGDQRAKPFTIIMPPPNANDNLHIGHARFVAIEDVLVRYHRMKGEPTLWLPGADHAGIETQYVFEKKLQSEGKSRFDFDRETLYRMVWDYVQENKYIMEGQLRALGASCDWSRNKFTLDPDIIKIVYQTFKKLYGDGLVYKGQRLINYCPRCGTGYSELEVDGVERDTEIYYLDYGLIQIATTRPETIFADVAVAVNPKDKRYKSIIGKKAIIPLIKREIPIIEDVFVDQAFGTGALKITPAHDFVDFEIGQRHALKPITVIDENGKMNINAPQKYLGMDVVEARKAVVVDLRNARNLIKTEPHHQVIRVCYRCKGVIEPMLSWQWFLKVAPLVKLARQAVKNRETKFAAKKFEKIYFHWLDNLRDWNISRQIVWGIRIPAWYCAGCGKTIVSETKPGECDACGVEQFDLETDTFDTWFSSGQWPFATLQTTKPGDFKHFYPTSVMETGYDILPFWVMRMMMLGLYATGKVPFYEILIHGLVRDKSGQKISKSKGNVIDPLVMVEKYGADALRMALVWGAVVENDISLSEDNVKGQRNFANKLWNIARFLVSDPGRKDLKKSLEKDRELEILVEKTVGFVNRNMEKYHLSQAAERLYTVVWHELADKYIEDYKKGLVSYSVLVRAYSTLLKLLHPFMPFITEEIWGILNRDKTTTPLIISSWPS